MSHRHRMNIRNAMVPMTVAEGEEFRDGLALAGDIVGAEYADEFLRELFTEFHEYDDCDEWE